MSVVYPLALIRILKCLACILIRAISTISFVNILNYLFMKQENFVVVQDPLLLELILFAI